MATKLELTWDKATHRWCKVYLGKKHYLGYGKSKSDRTSYEAALEKWAVLKAEIDATVEKPHRREYEQAIHLRREMLNWLTLEQDNREQYDLRVQAENRLRPVGPAPYKQCPGCHVYIPAEKPLCPKCGHAVTEPPESPFALLDQWPTFQQAHDRIAKELDQLNRQFARTIPPELDKPGTLPIDPLAYRPYAERMFWAENLTCLRQYEKWIGGPDNPERTVGGQIDAYLAARKTEARAGQISPQRFKVMESNLAHFKQTYGEVAMEHFNGNQLSAYHATLLQNVTAGKWTATYAKMFLTDVKTFVNWLDRMEVIDHVPKIMRSLKIDLDEAEPIGLTVDEVKTLLNGKPGEKIQGATGKTRLYILLMLNCGYTQKDIGDLQPSQVDWTNGRIERKRSKTRKKKNVPKVNYKLWPDCFDLMKEFGARTGERVVLNDRGKPLRDMTFNGKERDGLHTGDSIRKAIVSLCTTLNIDPIQPKRFRKTSATLLFNHPQYRQFHELFLGHAPKTIAEKHYVGNEVQVLDEALKWLGQQYGLMPPSIAPSVE